MAVILPQKILQRKRYFHIDPDKLLERYRAFMATVS